MGGPENDSKDSWAQRSNYVRGLAPITAHVFDRFGRPFCPCDISGTLNPISWTLNSWEGCHALLFRWTSFPSTKDCPRVPVKGLALALWMQIWYCRATTPCQYGFGSNSASRPCYSPIIKKQACLCRNGFIHSVQVSAISKAKDSTLMACKGERELLFMLAEPFAPPLWLVSG